MPLADAAAVWLPGLRQPAPALAGPLARHRRFRWPAPARPAARWAGGTATFPEHIAFISRRWLQTQVPRAGGRLLEVESFDYLGAVSYRSLVRCWRWLEWLEYLARPAHDARKRHAYRERTGSERAVPGIELARDHLLIRMTRPRKR